MDLSFGGGVVRTGKARAHANIALIKYWGKRDEDLVLPMNGSLSLTLEGFYTETQVRFCGDIDRDYFYLNGVLQSEADTGRVSRFLDLFRQSSGIDMPARVKSVNHFPTAAGLASSASGFSALAAAANVATGLNLGPKELSMYARRGSGSATRSIYGGFTEWKEGAGDKDSYAIPVDDASWDIAMAVVIVNAKEKALSSREGMKRTAATSPFYRAWVDSSRDDLAKIKAAIKGRDFEQMGRITESNGLKMHALMLSAYPPISYFEPESVLVMQRVRELRDEGIMCYFTMDAGPNVKILCRLSESHIIKENLKRDFDGGQIIINPPGPGVTIL